MTKKTQPVKKDNFLNLTKDVCEKYRPKVIVYGKRLNVSLYTQE